MIQRIDPGPRMSEASIHGDVAYLAGQVPLTADADIETQTREVLAEIDELLARCGTDKTRILRAQIYLADIADFAGMNRVGCVGGARPGARARHRRSTAGR